MSLKYFILISLSGLCVACGGSTSTSATTDDAVVDDAGHSGDGVSGADGATATDANGGNLLSLGANGCPADFEKCGNVCTNPAFDPKHCGNCDTACAKGEACVDGLCESVLKCGTGEKVCKGACTKVLSDSANCGSCGNACPTGHTCTDGTCGVPKTGCQAFVQCTDNCTPDPTCLDACWNATTSDGQKQYIAVVCCALGDVEGGSECTGITAACPENKGVCDRTDPGYVQAKCDACIQQAATGVCKDTFQGCL